MTREEIIAGFHKLYLENIAKETAKRGKLGATRGGGIPIAALTKIHDDTIAEIVGRAVAEHDRLGRRSINEMDGFNEWARRAAGIKAK